jgi:hypothetical protein
MPEPTLPSVALVMLQILAEKLVRILVDRRQVVLLTRGTLGYVAAMPAATTTFLQSAHISVHPGAGEATVGANTWIWIKWVTPTIVGTVMVIVNEALSTTSSSTIFHTRYQNVSDMSLFTPTNTNAAGTVTDIIPLVTGGYKTV